MKALWIILLVAGTGALAAGILAQETLPTTKSVVVFNAIFTSG